MAKRSRTAVRRKRAPRGRTRSNHQRARRPRARDTSTRVDEAKSQALRQKFVEAFPRFYSVTATAKAVGIHRDTHYDWLKTAPGYAEAFAKARVDAIDVLQGQLHTRALAGSDTCLIFALKGLLPEVYNRKMHEHSGPNGGPIPVSAHATVMLYLPDNRRTGTKS